MQSKYTLEVCTSSLNSVINAVEAGAQRVELCSALSVGGLTPSIGLLKTVRKMFPHLLIHVLIRPREGNFVYSEEEMQVMLKDIDAALPYADAVVCGALDIHGQVDMDATRRLVDASQGKPFTFHRAFDRCSDPTKALDDIMALGCTRLLTSGLEETAMQGVPLIKRLVERAGQRLIVMPGSGVAPGNARHILHSTGAVEIHGSASSLQPSGLKETTVATVRSLLAELNL